MLLVSLLFVAMINPYSFLNYIGKPYIQTIVEKISENLNTTVSYTHGVGVAMGNNSSKNWAIKILTTC